MLTAAPELPPRARPGPPGDRRAARDTLAPGAALRIAVLVPCLNEEMTVGQVVRDFSAALPGATVYVYDNNSSDGTVPAARAAGAVTRRETLQGKGHVVRRMFANVEADVYVLVDGDGTYDADAAPTMVRMLVQDRLDMVTAVRISTIAESYRRGHRMGNVILTSLVAHIFGARVADMLSGYRAFSRRFVKSFPALPGGFETETEFTVHALELQMPLGEVPSAYKSRPAGSSSKLRTVRDGLRIMRLILVLLKAERPLQFFGLLSALLFCLGLGLGLPVVMEFFATGLVPRLPSAVLATGLVLLSFLMLSSGLVLDLVARARKEAKHLAYLRYPAPGEGAIAPAPAAAGDLAG